MFSAARFIHPARLESVFLQARLSLDTHSYLRAFTADQRSATLKEYFDILPGFLRKTLCSFVREGERSASASTQRPQSWYGLSVSAQGCHSWCGRSSSWFSAVLLHPSHVVSTAGCKRKKLVISYNKSCIMCFICTALIKTVTKVLSRQHGDDKRQMSKQEGRQTWQTLKTSHTRAVLEGTCHFHVPRKMFHISAEFSHLDQVWFRHRLSVRNICSPISAVSNILSVACRKNKTTNKKSLQRCDQFSFGEVQTAARYCKYHYRESLWASSVCDSHLIWDKKVEICCLLHPLIFFSVEYYSRRKVHHV